MATKIYQESKKRLLSARPNPIEKNTPEITDLVSIEDSVMFIAHRVKDASFIFADAVDKVRKQINYAIQNGKIDCQGEKVQFGDLIQWVLSKKDWIDKFKEFHTAKANITTPSISCRMLANVPEPETLKECHEEIIRQFKKTIELKEEIDRLRPLEQAAKKRKEDARRAGLKGRGTKKNY